MALPLLPLSCLADGFVETNLSLSYDDNISRSWKSDTKHYDTRLEAKLTAGQYIEFESANQLSYSFSAAHNVYEVWDGFDHTDLTLRLQWKKKLGLGAFVPSWGLRSQFSDRNYKADVRDGTLTNLETFWSKRLNQDWDIAFSLGYEWLKADETIAAGPSGSDPGMGPGPGPGPGPADEPMPGDSFDQKAIAFAFNAGLALSDTHLLEFNYQFRDGEVASSALPLEEIIEAATAITRDTAFDGDYFAYKLDGQSHTLGVAWNSFASDNVSWTIEYQYQYTDATAGISYEQNIVRVGLGYLF